MFMPTCLTLLFLDIINLEKFQTYIMTHLPLIRPPSNSSIVMLRVS